MVNCLTILKKNGVVEKAINLGTLQKKAVKDAWAQEKELIEKTGTGTVEWSAKQIRELKKKGKVKGYVGHHYKQCCR